MYEKTSVSLVIKEMQCKIMLNLLLIKQERFLKRKKLSVSKGYRKYTHFVDESIKMKIHSENKFNSFYKSP